MVQFARFIRRAGGECQVVVRRESFTELMSKSSHGPADVDFADGMPFEFSFGKVEEGIDAEWSKVVVAFKKGFERAANLLFGAGHDLIGDDLRVLDRHSDRGLGGGGGAEPLAVFADFLTRYSEATNAALFRPADLIEEGELHDFFQPGFDEEITSGNFD